MLKKISTVGDSHVICDFGENVDLSTNSEVIKLFDYIKLEQNQKKFEGLLNCTPSYNKLLIHFDIEQIKSNKVIERIKSLNFTSNYKNKKTKIKNLPICYDEEFALDLLNIEEKLKMNFSEIIKKHQEINFFIYMIGFIPGHPFMGDLDKNLYLSRLSTPRLKVPKGSVGIVEKFCNIYTFDSPGGWNIIGRTPIELFNINNKISSKLKPGDIVKFQSITKSELKKLNEW
mgnify:CR=1 FL=1|jgi:inhibitor of KinA|tara:strand:- start:76 stop:765 length:690 start_codon:yes stop_codon:yes gene_type:complete